jgi:hypothetical protein
MKASKGLIFVCFLAISITSCFNPPEFSDTPEVSFSKIQFKEVPGATADSLILYIDFRDGDGDLGLYADMINPPFNYSFYYLADGTGGLIPVTTDIVYTTDGTESFELLNVPFGASGKLVTDQTRNLPEYDTLPAYDPNSCLNYSLAPVLVAESDNVVDNTYNIIDTLFDDADNLYFLIEEPILYVQNPYHNNIDVEYWVFENGSFVEYNWLEELCTPDFNGRFPVLTNKAGSQVEGTIRYGMGNTSFLALFSIKKLKLKVKIRDRALNTSNEIETPQFDLRGIQIN